MAQKTTASGSNAEVTIDDLSNQIATLKNELASLTQTLGNYGKSKQAELTETARATAHDLAETGRARAVHTQEQAEDFVRTQPATALGIAAGLGFLIGMMTARK